MQKIGLLSDTHSWLDPKLKKFFADCDEIWHAGDVGQIEVIQQLEQWKPLRAVYGNIDDHIVRTEFPENLVFDCEQVKVFMTHIGGYPNRYYKQAKEILQKERPRLFISGHSHILKVQFDSKLNCLHVNPGAAGNQGFHKIRTAVRFVIEGIKIRDLEVIELGMRGVL